MLGDDLKKSLEPIQVSDELLEKTRKAIEKARLEQAAASLNDTSSVSRKASPRLSYFLKAAIPLACIVLVVGGLALLIPRLSKDNGTEMKSDRAKSAQQSATMAYAADTTVAEHNMEIDNIAEVIEDERENSGDSYDDNKSAAAETTETENNAPEASETDGGMESQANTEETDSDNKYLTPSLEVLFSENTTTEAGDFLICISEDGKSLYLRDKATDEIVPESEEHRIPTIENLGEDALITGIEYKEDTKLLYITVTIHGVYSDRRILYVCDFDNGTTGITSPFIIASD